MIVFAAADVKAIAPVSAKMKELLPGYTPAEDNEDDEYFDDNEDDDLRDSAGLLAQNLL